MLPWGAYAVLEGDSPARLLCDLDRLAKVTGLGSQARLVYLSFRPGTGELRFSNAGSCPLLLLSGGRRRGRFLDTARSAPLGVVDGLGRPEEMLNLAPGSAGARFPTGWSRAGPRRGGRGWSGSGRPPLTAPMSWTSSATTSWPFVPPASVETMTSASSVCAGSPMPAGNEHP